MDDPAAGAAARANRLVTGWLAGIAAVALGVIAAVTFCDVIARYIFNAPFSFTVVITEMAMGMIVYFGVGLVTHDDAHISADFVTLRLSPRVRALFAAATNLLALGFLVLMVWQLWRRAAFLLAKGDVTQVLDIPLWPAAFAMALGSVFLLTGVLLQLVAACRRLMDRVHTPVPGEPAPPSAERG